MTKEIGALSLSLLLSPLFACYFHLVNIAWQAKLSDHLGFSALSCYTPHISSILSPTLIAIPLDSPTTTDPSTPILLSSFLGASSSSSRSGSKKEFPVWNFLQWPHSLFNAPNRRPLSVSDRLGRDRIRPSRSPLLVSGFRWFSCITSRLFAIRFLLSLSVRNIPVSDMGLLEAKKKKRLSVSLLFMKSDSFYASSV